MLEEHAVRDEVSTQDEEQLDPLAPEGLQRGPVDVRPGQPLRVLFDVVDEDRETRDAAQPIEPVKVGWFRRRGHALTLSRRGAAGGGVLGTGPAQPAALACARRFGQHVGGPHRGERHDAFVESPGVLPGTRYPVPGRALRAGSGTGDAPDLVEIVK